MVLSLILSRVLGIARDTVMTAKFGIGLDTDAYRLAFQIPDLLFFLIAGGALSSAFIPVFSEYLHTNREKDAWKLFSVVVTLMSLIVFAFILLAWIFAHPLSAYFAEGKSATIVPDIVYMSRVLLPSQYAFFIGGLMFGTLYARQRFAAPGLAPNIYNLGIIFGAVVLSSFFTVGIYGMAWGATVGAVTGNLILPLIVMRRLGVQFTPSLDLRAPGVKQVFVLMAPVVLGLSLPQVYALIMQKFASEYGAAGVNTYIDLSNKLMQAPLGIFGQALALAVFPALSQFFAQKKMDNFRLQMVSTLRTVVYLTLPSAALLMALAPDVTAAVYGYGAAKAEETMRIADCLVVFSIGLVAWSMQPVLMRGFFALQKSVTPIVLGTCTTVVFVLLVLMMRDSALGYLSLPLAGSISAILLVIAMLIAVEKAMGGLDYKSLGVTFGKCLFASAIVGAAAFAVSRMLPMPGEAARLVPLFKVFGIGLGAAWAYFFITRAMKMKETDYVSRAMDKFNRKVRPITPQEGDND